MTEILRILMYVSGGLDLGSTWKGLSFGQREANPILGQSKRRQVVIIFGSIITADLVARWLYGQSAAAAYTVLIAIAAVHFLAFKLNLRKVR